MRKAGLPTILQPLREAALLNFVVELLKSRGLIKEQEAMIALASHEITLSPEQEKLRRRIDETIYVEAFATSSGAELAVKLAVTPAEAEEMIAVLLASRDLVRLEGDIFVHARRLQEARERIIAFLRNHEQGTVSQLKDLLGNTSRKYTVPILQHFDGIGVTERRGDVRVLGAEGG
jgi:selenocysteine-specific elongation factor